MQRFYLPPKNFRGDYIVTDDPKLLHQLSQVLRVRHGDKFLLFNGDGLEYLGQLVELSKKEAKFLVIDSYAARCEPRRQVTLYQSLLKSDKFDWLVQKAVELGVYRIVPVVSRYSIVKTLTPAKRLRYEEIIKQAAEQCGGVRLVELSPVLTFDASTSEAANQAGAKIIAWEKENEYALADTASENVFLFIGPEGGFSEEEIELAGSKQIIPVSLGPRILRAETAALAALAKLL